MNLTRAQKIRLGTFMATGTFLFVAGVTVLAGLKIWERKDTYTVRFNEDVSGLEESAPVKYQGLRVGQVTKMRIAEKDKTAIEVTLELEPGTTLFGGTQAVLSMSGLTGLKSINLVPGDPKAAVIEPGSILPAGRSLMNLITGKADAIAVKVEKVANQLAAWTNDENRKRTEKLIDSLTQLADETERFLSTNREPFRDAMNGVAGASHSIDSLTSQGNRSLVMVRNEVTQTLQETRTTLKELRRPFEHVDSKELAQTVSSANRAMQSLDRRLSSEELGKAIDGMVVALADLRRLLEAVDLSVRAGREDLIGTLADLRQAAEDVKEFSRIIAQDPSALIRGKD